MAYETAHCKCKTCGEEFSRREMKHSRTEADSWVKWAEATFDECPECYRKRIREKEEKEADAYGFPELTKGSEKQIAFANSLRLRYIAGGKANVVKIIRKRIAKIEEEKELFEAKASEAGMTLNDYIVSSMKKSNIYEVYVCMTSTDARVIIDALGG